tara:strand:+ start:24 stop:266 length:243 start_codon:yes stop_codon:yes gene_type:complete
MKKRAMVKKSYKAGAKVKAKKGMKVSMKADRNNNGKIESWEAAISKKIQANMKEAKAGMKMVSKAYAKMGTILKKKKKKY